MSAIATTEHHGHDDHHDDHHEGSFWTKYLFSFDHKMIAKQFLITGIFWAVIGGGMSMIFRLQLAFPDADFSWLEPIIGKWVVGGTIKPEFYYALVTMHGIILVFFVLTAGLSGTFANLLIPLQIGARDMASPLMNCLSYWFFNVAGIIVFISLMLPTGPAAGGWTLYPPLSAVPAFMPGSGTGMTLLLVGMTLFITSSLLGGLNYVATVLNMRTKGMSMTRMPLTIWAIFFTAVIGVLAFPALLAASILLVFDRMGTSFYLNEIYASGIGHLDKFGGSPILFQHLFWFLGHPEVYIIILPAMGLVSEVMSNQARKPIFGYRAMILSILGITILSFIVWAHHMFISGLNPYIGAVFMFLTLLIAIPSAIKVFNWITTIWKGNVHFSPQMLFCLGFVSTFISGGLTGIWLGNSTMDIALHDTYFVVAHFHIVMGTSAMFGMFAGVYHWFPKMYGRFMNRQLGYLHFFLTFFGAYGVFWPMHYLGMAGVPRRYYAFSNYDFTNDFGSLNIFITVCALIGFGSQFIFVVNFFLSIFRGRELTVLNPWKSNSIEWTTPIERIHGNWPGEIPEVYRWAYDYSKPGAEEDFIPQTTPLGTGEQESH